MSALLADALLDDARLDALLRLRLLDTPPEEPFDRLTRLAARVLQAPIALVSLVDDHRQFFKSACGLPEPWASGRETPLSHSFCQHVVANNAPLIVEDARTHPFLHDNAAVADLNAIAYLGIPLATPTGTVLGSFCVIDTQPRQWTSCDRETMTELAASVMSEIALRYAHDEMHAANCNLQKEAAHRDSLLEALEHSEARLSTAQRLARVGSFVLQRDDGEPNGHWSEEARRILSITEAGAPASIAAFVERLVHPEDRARVAAEFDRAIRSGVAGQIEYRTCVPGPDVRSLMTVIEPERTQGDVKTVLCTALDTTERNRVEVQLADYRNELWHVARVATAGEMATVVAHEINQPLAAIAHTASACSRLSTAGTIGSKELAEHLADISSQARRASEIIRRIRHYVRKAPLSQAPVNLVHVVNDIRSMLSPLSRKSGIRVEHVTAGHSPLVMGDEIQLGQLVLNLVRNAFDAVATNAVNDRNVMISINASEADCVALEVGDNGPGIPVDLQSRIFEPFYTTRRNGLGMGLSIARTIADAHQATLTIGKQTGQNRGAIFQVVFPAVQERLEPANG